MLCALCLLVACVVVKVKDSWLAELFTLERHIIVRKKGAEPGKGWVLPLRCVGGVAALVWPLLERCVEMEGRQIVFYQLQHERPNSMDDLVVVCCDAGAWEARAFSWRPPSWQARQYSKAARYAWGDYELSLFPESDTLPLVTLACEKAFWDLPKSWLQKFAAVEGLSLSGGLDLFGALYMLLQHVLGSDDEKTLSCLAQRFATVPSAGGSSIGKLLECDEAMSILDKGDVAEASGLSVLPWRSNRSGSFACGA